MSTYLTWISGSNLILSNNHSRATLWARETCLIVGPLLFKNLDNCLIVFKNVQQSIMVREFCVRSDVINVSQTTFFRHEFGKCLTLRIARGLPKHRNEGDGECDTSLTNSHSSKGSIPSMRKQASKDITSPTDWYERSAAEMHKHPPDVDFLFFLHLPLRHCCELVNSKT